MTRRLASAILACSVLMVFRLTAAVHGRTGATLSGTTCPRRGAPVIRLLTRLVGWVRSGGVGSRWHRPAEEEKSRGPRALGSSPHLEGSRRADVAGHSVARARP